MAPPTAPATVLGKALLILQAFTAEDHDQSFGDLLRRTDLAKATLHRLLGDLVAARLLDRDERGRYRLSRLVFELGMRASVERGVLEVAIPFLEDLYERTHETVHLGLREGSEVVYVAKMGGHQQAETPSRLGGRMPLHATAIGKALLAHAPPEVKREVLAGPLQRLTPRTVTAPGLLRRQFDEAVKRGVCFEHEESASGVVCVAAAVLGPGDDAVAAISITGPVHRFRPSEHAALVRGAAVGIASTLARREALQGGHTAQRFR